MAHKVTTVVRKVKQSGESKYGNGGNQAGVYISNVRATTLDNSHFP